MTSIYSKEPKISIHVYSTVPHDVNTMTSVYSKEPNDSNISYSTVWYQCVLQYPMTSKYFEEPKDFNTFYSTTWYQCILQYSMTSKYTLKNRKTSTYSIVLDIKCQYILQYPMTSIYSKRPMIPICSRVPRDVIASVWHDANVVYNTQKRQYILKNLKISIYCTRPLDINVFYST